MENQHGIRAIFLLQVVTNDYKMNNSRPKTPHDRYVQSLNNLNHINSCELILSRRFNIVEKRLRQSCINDGHKEPMRIPMDGEFAAMLQKECVLNVHETNIPPITSLNDGQIWPIVIQRTSNNRLFFVVIPAVCPHQYNRYKSSIPNVHVSEGITAAVAFLNDIQPYMQNLTRNSMASMNNIAEQTTTNPTNDTTNTATTNSTPNNINGNMHASMPKFTPTSLSMLKKIFKFIIPFGRYVGFRPNDIEQILRTGSLKTPSFVNDGTTIPAWKPHIIVDKRRPELTFTIIENLRYVTYGMRKNQISDGCTVSGTIHCRANIIGLPIISINLHALDGISGLRFHQCVDSVTAHDGTAIRFEPPIGEFCLASYMLGNPERMPFLAQYNVRRVNSLQLSIDFSFILGHSIDRGFEYAYAIMSFKNHGLLVGMEHLEYYPNALDIPVLDTVGSMLIWKLGEDFLHHKCHLKALLTFEHDHNISQPSHTSNDPYLSGITCCAEILFECPGYTLSGVNLLQTDVKVQIPKFENQEVLLHPLIHQKVVAKLLVWNQCSRVMKTTAPSDITFNEAREFYNNITTKSPYLRNKLHDRCVQLENAEKHENSLYIEPSSTTQVIYNHHDDNGDVVVDNNNDMVVVVAAADNTDEKENVVNFEPHKDIQIHPEDEVKYVENDCKETPTIEVEVVKDENKIIPSSSRKRKKKKKRRGGNKQKQREQKQHELIEIIPKPKKKSDTTGIVNRNKTLEERLAELIPKPKEDHNKTEEEVDTHLRKNIFSSSPPPPSSSSLLLLNKKSHDNTNEEDNDDVDVVAMQIPRKQRSKSTKPSRSKRKKKTRKTKPHISNASDESSSELYEFLRRVRNESKRKKREVDAEKEELERGDWRTKIFDER